MECFLFPLIWASCWVSVRGIPREYLVPEEPPEFWSEEAESSSQK